MISALLADVDVTLVTKEKILTQRAIEAVHRLHDNGIAFFITSGRPPRGMRMLVEPLGLKTPMAAFNGGMIVNPDLSVVDERTLPDDACRTSSIYSPHTVSTFGFTVARIGTSGRRRFPTWNARRRRCNFLPRWFPASTVC